MRKKIAAALAMCVAAALPFTVHPGAASAEPVARPAAALPSQCTGTAPIVCRFAVAPGNYDVTAMVGDQSRAGNISVTVEATLVFIVETLFSSAATL